VAPLDELNIIMGCESTGAKEVSVKISVFIPVFRESKLLTKTLKTLTEQEVRKEIFVVVDEPSEKCLKILEGFERDVKVIINGKRVGKVKALNEAVKLSSGEILLFLDADVEVPEDPKFLEKVIEEIKDADFLDLNKEVIKDSFLSRMTYYEYVGFNMCSWFITRFVGKCPGVNGTAFAVKKCVFDSVKGFRRVVSEDLDIAFRAFLKSYRFKYTKKLKVYNHVHSSLEKWIRQRRRWAVGQALWLKEWRKELLRIGAKNPQVYAPALLFLFPSLMPLIFNILLPNSLVYNIAYLISLLVAVKFSLPLSFPILVLTTSSLDALKGILISLTCFLIYAFLFFAFSAKLGFKFRPHEFFVYYFFYSPLNLLIAIAGLIRVFIFKEKSVSYWKV